MLLPCMQALLLETKSRLCGGLVTGHGWLAVSEEPFSRLAEPCSSAFELCLPRPPAASFPAEVGNTQSSPQALFPSRTLYRQCLWWLPCLVTAPAISLGSGLSGPDCPAQDPFTDGHPGSVRVCFFPTLSQWLLSLVDLPSPVKGQGAVLWGLIDGEVGPGNGCASDVCSSLPGISLGFTESIHFLLSDEWLTRAAS